MLIGALLMLGYFVLGVVLLALAVKLMNGDKPSEDAMMAMGYVFFWPVAYVVLFHHIATEKLEKRRLERKVK